MTEGADLNFFLKKAGSCRTNPPGFHADNLGAFKGPNQLLGHLQISYAMSPRMSLALNVANVIDTCFGGDKQPWTALADHRVCSYSLPGYSGLTPSVGNVYNPGAVFQPFIHFPYQQYFGTSPTAFYMSVKIKM